MKPSSSAEHLRRAGFTLAELLVSVTVAGILLVGLGSALTMVTRSMRPDASAAVTLDAARAIRLLEDDLRFSSHVLSRSATSVKLLTTDADQNGNPDVVEYNWSGTSGASLTRTVNGGTAVAVCADVVDFALEFLNDGESRAVLTSSAAGGEVLLQSHTSTSNMTWHTVGYSDAYGQLIQPSSFTGTAALTGSDEWKITRVDYYAKRETYDSATYRFDLDLAGDDGLPSHEHLYQATLDPSVASSTGGWYSVAVSDCPWIDATQPVTLTLTYLDDSNRLMIVESSASGASGMLTTDESATEWLRPSHNRSLLYRVYGMKRTKAHSDESVSVRRLMFANIRLATSALVAQPLHAGAELMNRPFDTTHKALTNFSNWSLTDDSNSDGSVDWNVSATSSPSTSTVASGLWTASSQSLQLNGSIAAGSTVQTHVVCRDTSSATGGIQIRMAVPTTSSSSSVSSLLMLELQSDGSQTLTVYEEASTNVYAKAAQYRSLVSGLQDIHCVMNTSSQTLHVWVNGVWMGAHRIGLISSPSVTATVQIQAGASSCEFDACEVCTWSSSGGTSVEGSL
ncbi:MAG: prepilin-type N-terminal cleavage/methylation domain-containing protein [Planctomycetaceae bacterium]|nr:prepilin-type N-terminal cleavage/methylation domain-containing protein [Planctomycetaceae bacterium]